ncbi:MAG: DUF917 domain-containing protein [Stellaceae bacterium]
MLAPITLDDIEALAVGAWILGTGGGGSPYLGLLNMRRLYAEGRRVSLMSPLDLADDDWVAVVSNMGAPLVGQERLADSRNIARAVEIQRGLLGADLRAVMALEIGGGNSIQPLMAAAHLGLPVIDADTMGRAYPEAQMTSVAVGDLRPYPCVLYDPRGIEAVVTKVPDWKWMERVSRKICVELGSIASTCKAPRTGREIKECGIHFTVSKAVAIGRRVRQAQRDHDDPVAAVLQEGRGKLPFRGKVIGVGSAPTSIFCLAAPSLGITGDGEFNPLPRQGVRISAWRKTISFSRTSHRRSRRAGIVRAHRSAQLDHAFRCVGDLQDGNLGPTACLRAESLNRADRCSCRSSSGTAFR